MQEWYHGYWAPMKISKNAINKMIKNMKKTKNITEKSDKYHKNEEKEADNILKQLQE